MKTRLSAMLDDATGPDELDTLCRALGKTDELRDCSRIYPLIGPALRGESLLDTDITASVMRRLEGEPLMAPFRPRLRWQRPAMALAASMAGIAVVAWLALPLARQAAPTQPSSGGGVGLASASPAVSERAIPTRDMQEYLIAHQSQVAGLQFLGGSEHVRTVSYDSGK